LQSVLFFVKLIWSDGRVQLETTKRSDGRETRQKETRETPRQDQVRLKFQGIHSEEQKSSFFG